MSYSFLKNETFGLRTQTTFVGNTCEFYIPAYFFDPAEKMGSISGITVEALGLFWFKIDEKEWYELQMPIKFPFTFSERRKEKMKLRPDIPELAYEVFVLKNGDAFMYDINHKQDSEEGEWFLTKLIEGAKLPPLVPYMESFNLLKELLIVTGLNTSWLVPSLVLENILSVIYRAKGNLSDPLRLHYKGKPYSYKMVRITKIPQLESDFQSLIGEDINQQLVSSVVRTREGKNISRSPIEKLIKY